MYYAHILGAALRAPKQHMRTAEPATACCCVGYSTRIRCGPSCIGNTCAVCGLSCLRVELGQRLARAAVNRGSRLSLGRPHPARATVNTAMRRSNVFTRVDRLGLAGLPPEGDVDQRPEEEQEADLQQQPPVRTTPSGESWKPAPLRRCALKPDSQDGELHCNTGTHPQPHGSTAPASG